MQYPGHAENLIITTDARWLVRWHTGAVSLAAARKAGGIRMEGPRNLIRAFGTWGGLSPLDSVEPVIRPEPIGR